jgi:hypothetical protein
MKRQVDKIIGFDMDGVILDQTNLKIRLAKKYGWEIKPEQTYSDMVKKFIPREEWRIVQAILYDDLSVALKSPLTTGVKPLFKYLKNKKVPFYLISRRKIPENAIKILKKHELWPKYFNKKNSFFVSTKKDKDKYARKLRITHYIDDQWTVLDELKFVKNRFLFDPIGASDNTNNYIVVSNLKEFREYIK